MIGAILGDIIGSPYEFDCSNIKAKQFPLFSERSRFTDDTVMTLAVAQAFMQAGPDAEDDVIRRQLIQSMQDLGRRYPDAGYGGRFSAWLRAEEPVPYHSFGNGAAMRVSPVAWLYDNLEQVRHAARLSAGVTHDHPEGLKGAEATASAIFLARTGQTKADIRDYIQQEFGYPLDRCCDDIRPGYRHVESCMETVPEAITAFLEGGSFEDVIRTAVSLGGDSDTLAAIAGSIAESYYTLPVHWIQACLQRLPQDLGGIVRQFGQLLSSRSDVIKGYRLEGNETIEQAIADAYRTHAPRAEVTVRGLLHDQMLRRGELLVPVTPAEGQPGAYRPTVYTQQNAGCWLFAFTGMDAYRNASACQVLSLPVEDVLQAALSIKRVKGIVFNPLNEESFPLPRDGILLLLGEQSIENAREKDRQPALLHDAIIFATRAHKGQLRKGTDVDYICHPLEVLQILTSMQADTELLIAGVLHDTVEDTAVTVEDIRSRFGEGAAALVAHHSEDKSKSWTERKTAAIQAVRDGDFRLKMLVMADKLSNLRSILADLREQGDAVWERFNASKSQQAWYYSEMQAALDVLQESPYTADAYWEMVNTYKDIFVRFYISRDGQRVYQIADSGEIHMRELSSPEWRVIPEVDTSDLFPASRLEIEYLEDLWDDEQTQAEGGTDPFA